MMISEQQTINNTDTTTSHSTSIPPHSNNNISNTSETLPTTSPKSHFFFHHLLHPSTIQHHGYSNNNTTSPSATTNSFHAHQTHPTTTTNIQQLHSTTEQPHHQQNNLNITSPPPLSSPSANSPSSAAASFFKRLLTNLTPNLSRQNHLQHLEKKEQTSSGNHTSQKGGPNTPNQQQEQETNNVELDLDGLSVKSVESTPSVDISSNSTSDHQHGSNVAHSRIGDLFPKSKQEEEPSMDHIISRKLAQRKTKENSIKPADINAFTDHQHNGKVLTQHTVFNRDTPMPTSTPSSLLSGKVSADLFANIGDEADEKKKPKKKRQEIGIRNVETSVKTKNKTYLKKMTFMQSLSTSGDQHPTSSNSTKKGQQKDQAPFENDLLFNDLQVFKNQVFKRYCKILEQPMFCKAFNYEVLGPKEFLTNPYVHTVVENSPAISTSSSSGKEEENPFLFDEKIVKEFKWRRRKSDTNTSMPNVPTVDIVCEDGATLSCYFEMVGQNDQPSISTKQEDSTSSSTASKKTLLLFHDGSEEAFEYFFHPALRKFKDFIISMGLQIFIFEYRGFGFSTCAKGEDERSSLHRYLETDYKLIHHLFTTRLKIPMSQVVVYGKGFLGSTCAMHFVSNFPSVCGLCLESPCFDILKVVLGNLPENVLSYITSQGAEQSVVRPEDETIKFEFTKYNFGVEKYYRMPYPKNKKIMSTKQQNARPKTTIACKVGDERYYNLKEVKNCITHHFDVYSKLSCFPGKLLILFQQGNELVPYCDVENFFKCIKTGEKNMYLLSSNEISSMTNANDDPFNLFERKFFTCVRGIHKFMESIGHAFPDNFNQFLEKLFQVEQRLLEDQANQTSELSDLAASGSYVDTYESYGGRGRRNPYLPVCGGCGHCRACVDQSMIENEGTDNTDHDCDSDVSSEEP